MLVTEIDDVGRVDVPISNALLLHWFILSSSETDLAKFTGMSTLNDPKGETTLRRLLVLGVT